MLQDNVAETSGHLFVTALKSGQREAGSLLFFWRIVQLSLASELVGDFNLVRKTI